MAVTSKSPKILIIAPAWVGDLVMAQTLFKLLKSQHPNITIDVLAPPWSYPLLQSMPEVDRTWIADFPHKKLRLWQRYRLARQLRQQRYTQAILLPNSLKSALVPYWAQIPIRTGWRKEWPRHWLVNDTRTLDKAQLPKMIERFAALGLPKDQSLPAVLPWPALSVSTDRVESTLAKLQLTRPQQPLLVLAPGAEYGPAKRWPAQHFAAVVKAKTQQGWCVWLLGSTKDVEVNAEIQQACGGAALNLAGETQLSEAVDLLSLATVVVSNDSGLLHIAAALQKPVVAIYGPTSPTFAPPLAVKSEILYLNLSCSPCAQRVCPLGHWRCMLDLTPQEVLKSIARVYPC
ncbi:MAG: lipopolysaccharide heptosyltransferase II [Gammaproteobacteria bacterium]